MFANKEAGSLIIRLVLGVIFFAHGLQKFQGGIENTSGFFDSVGIPGFMAYVVAAIELVGGICMVLGLGTRIIAGAFFIIMLGAVATVKLSMGFIGGYELDVALIAMSLHLLVSGSSLLSLDRLMFGRSAEQK
ncbi:DoxX family protein [Paenibacillus apiarius]|uniref:DoxX family protein n=1 Tax=Paenibacillus apiarius TaxID=46240 RepID=A0ABT4DT57_9BACL|nr:DoxX family protein [Paenibacillus apiarius]MBN3524134.1 DoxX family protein [Paenibacillus apiarius]MCY9513921.1 DoxX family protein [Paenibacillus apiarius]MCY9519438.1 DoxX family protein [Paenibacillus apiarius]MCY9552335.1 DoxX family protein [Paenibacillus apiarius]MCY9556193.1 DoxX family protein [Paenibacillus apiarius]